MKFMIKRVLKNADILEKRAAKMRARPNFYAWMLLLTWIMVAVRTTLQVYGFIRKQKMRAPIKDLRKMMKERAEAELKKAKPPEDNDGR